MANDLGVANNTIKHWFSVMDASYVTLRLQPYYENFGKRIIKSSKLYFTAVGMVTHLLGIRREEQLQHERLRGSLFENLVLLELVKLQYNKGKDADLFYFRDNHGHEVDIIFKNHNSLIPIEVKSTATFHSNLLKDLECFKGLVVDRMPLGFLVYGGEENFKLKNIHVLSFR